MKGNGIKRLRMRVNELAFILGLNFVVIVPLAILFFMISSVFEHSYLFLYGSCLIHFVPEAGRDE